MLILSVIKVKKNVFGSFMEKTPIFLALENKSGTQFNIYSMAWTTIFLNIYCLNWDRE